MPETSYADYPAQKVVGPKLFYFNRATLEATLFSVPKVWIDKKGDKRAEGKVVFRGELKDQIGPRAQRYINLRVSARGDCADKMETMDEADKVRMTGYFTTKDFFGTNGKAYATLVFYVDSIEVLEHRGWVAYARKQKRLPL